MWVLVYISVVLGEPTLEKWETYSTMEECFQGRDNALVKLEAFTGLPPKGKQLVCINYKRT